jgi:hypothetical protein
MLRRYLELKLKEKNSKKLYLSQIRNIKKFLKRFDMDDVDSISCPLTTCLKLRNEQSLTTKETRRVMEKIPYVYVVGSLMYTIICIRPNIAQVVSLVSRFLLNPREQH